MASAKALAFGPAGSGLVLLLATLLVVAGCTSSGTDGIVTGSILPAVNATDRTIRNDTGGAILRYALDVKKMREQKRDIRFAGRCQSSCTLYLSLPRDQTCIAPGATFGFHLPYGASEDGNRRMAGYMMQSYPGWARYWIESKGGLSRRLKIMPYSYASRYLRPCTPGAAHFAGLPDPRAASLI